MRSLVVLLALSSACPALAAACRRQCVPGEQRDELGCCIPAAATNESIKPEKALVRTAWKVKLLKLKSGNQRAELRPVSPSKSRARKWDGGAVSNEDLDEGAPILVFREGGKVDVVGPRPGSLSLYGALDANSWSVIPNPPTLVLTVRNQPLFGTGPAKEENLHYALERVTKDELVISARVGEFTVEATLVPATTADIEALNHAGPSEDKSSPSEDKSSPSEDKSSPSAPKSNVRVTPTLPHLTGPRLRGLYCPSYASESFNLGFNLLAKDCFATETECQSYQEKLPQNLRQPCSHVTTGFWCYVTFNLVNGAEKASFAYCATARSKCEDDLRSRQGPYHPPTQSNDWLVARSDRCYRVKP